MANAANITRRSIFKLAPAAVLATGGAVIAFPAKSEPLTLDQEIEAGIEQLHALLDKKYPHVENSKQMLTEMRSGGFLFSIVGCAPQIAWSGAGYYEIFLQAGDKQPMLMWVDHYWCHVDQAYGYRAYIRENGQQVSVSEYFTEQSLNIHRKI